jgi:hypothetical protein
MLTLFRALLDRLQALFALGAARALEAEALALDAERRAELLRQADRYDAEGLPVVARYLRRQAEALGSQHPLAGVVPAARHLLDTPPVADARPPALPAPGREGASGPRGRKPALRLYRPPKGEKL